MKNLFIVSVLCMCTHITLGGIIFSSPDSGWGYDEEYYVLGATARNMVSAGDWELGTGTDSSMSQDTADLNWGGPGTSHSFVMDYDSGAKEAMWTVDGQDTTLSLAPATSFADLYIILKTGSSNDYISISNTMLTMDGSETVINDFEASGERDTDPNWLRHIHIDQTDGHLSDLDFVLAGTLYIDWTGETPSHDEVGMHVKLTQIPEPASIIMLILVSVTGLFVRRRFKV